MFGRTTSFSSKFTYFSSLWPRHGAIRATFGTIQAVTSGGPLRTVEQSPRKRESGSFHENRPLLLAIRELQAFDQCWATFDSELIKFGRGDNSESMRELASKMFTAFQASDFASPDGTIVAVEESMQGEFYAFGELI